MEIQIDTTELVSVMQELFPREYTICVQKVHIAKLEAKVEEQTNQQEAAVSHE